jgi:hypothetical protein
MNKIFFTEKEYLDYFRQKQKEKIIEKDPFIIFDEYENERHA